MRPFVIGINYKTCPEELREKVSLIKREILELLFKFKESSVIEEAVILSTCNRNEFYIMGDDIEKIRIVTTEYFKAKDPDLLQYLYSYEDKEVLDHLFKVTIGLDSMILFEDQILGQVRTAFELSQIADMSKKYLSKYFREAIALSKAVRSEYKVSEKPTSLSSTAVKYVKSRFRDKEEPKILVIGTGEMGRLALTHLIGEGFSDITVSNRTYHPGDLVTRKKEKFKTIEYSERYERITDFDVIISATASAHTILKQESFPQVKNPLLIIDLALPKDVERTVGELEKVTLITIDDFKEIIDHERQEQIKLIPLIERRISDKIDEIEKWEKQTAFDRILKTINDRKQTCIERACELIQKKIELDPSQQKNLNKIVKSEFNRLVRPIILALKQSYTVQETEILNKAYELILQKMRESEKC